MRCHYIYDKIAGKVWIPGCYGGIYGPLHCTCRPEIGSDEYYKEEFNKEVGRLKKEVKELEKLYFQSQRIIKKLLKL